jgi:K+-sensing histidine kinase KdpD
MVETGRNEKNNTSIIVTPEILPGNVIISFENAGTSLTEEKKMSLFSKFENENLHLDLTSTGLYTAYSLVKKYGGTIEAVDRIAGDSKKGLKLKVYLLRSYSYKPENLLT